MFSRLPSERFRYERKFFVEETDKHTVERMLRFHPAIFSEIYHERFVNNIYFDSMNLRAYQENLMGATERVKFRIRWYGRLLGDIEKPTLELKIKNNMLGAKLSYPLKQFRLDENFSRRLLQKEIFPHSDLPGWLVEGLKLLEPSLLNRYRRKYFLSADKRYRLTIDTDMEFYRIKHQKNSFAEKVGIGDCIVLELKYPREDDDDAERITNNLPFRMTKNSKYVSGIDLLDG